jgi:peptidoglycan/LPS O-acetylase OafA/YrhL
VTANKNHRNDLQGVRGIAVLLVVLYHAGEIVPGGFIGVDVFFVLSGFVIGASILRESESTGTLSLSNFYSRRVRRILPAYALMATTTLVVFVYFLSPFGNQQVMAKTSAAASVWLSNMALARADGGGYFAPGSDENPFLHTWSLGVEEQFYIFLPIAMVAIFASLAKRSGSPTRRIQAVLGITAFLSLALSIALVDLEIDIDPGIGALTFTPAKLGFYLSLARFWELLAGVLLATVVIRANASDTERVAVGGVGVALLAYTAFTYDDFTSFPGVAAILPVVATLLLIWAGTSAESPFARVMAFGPLRFVGDNSYSWYLWHWPAIVLAALMWSDSRVALLIAGFAALIPAWLSRTLVEEPLRRNKSIVGKKAFGLAVICVGVPLAVSAVVFLGAKGNWGLDKPDGWDDIPVAREAGCHVDDVSNVKAWDRVDCTFPATGDSAETILVLGDSHASSLASATIEAGNRLGYDVAVWSGSGCPFMEGFGPTAQLGDCRAWVDDAFALVDTIAPAAIVIVNRATIYTQSEFGEPENPLARIANTGGNKAESHAEAVEMWEAGTAATLDRLGNIPTLITGTVPEYWPDFIDEYSLARPDLDVSMTREEVEARQFGVDAATIAAVAVDDNARFLDPTDVLCPGTVCSPIDDDGWRYYDQDHLNQRGALLLSDTMEDALSDLIS